MASAQKIKKTNQGVPCLEENSRVRTGTNNGFRGGGEARETNERGTKPKPRRDWDSSEFEGGTVGGVSQQGGSHGKTMEKNTGKKDDTESCQAFNWKLNEKPWEKNRSPRRTHKEGARSRGRNRKVFGPPSPESTIKKPYDSK